MSTPPGSGPPPPPTGPPPSYPDGSPWGAAQPDAPRGRGATVWVLGGLAVLVVIVLTVAATLFVTGRNSEEAGPDPTKPSPTTAVDTSEIASADDDGPVKIITEDPTCAAWTPIAQTFSSQASKGWNDRDPAIPADRWSPEQKAQHQDIADAMRSAADETVALVKLTPHRVMRELYGQAIAYWRAYADAVPTYSPEDDPLALTATAASNAIGNICSAIDWGSAAARAPLVPPSPAAFGTGVIDDPAKPSRYLKDELAVCADWISAAERFDAETAEWLKSDPNIPAAQWSPEQLAIYRQAAVTMRSNAGEMQNLGAQSLNPIFDDVAALQAQYRRAFVQSITTYTPADAYLANTSAELTAMNSHACTAVGAT